MPKCKKCGMEYPLRKSSMVSGLCLSCTKAETETKPEEALAAPEGKAFDCMITNQPFTLSEELIPDFSPNFRKARAKIQHGKIEFVCDTMDGLKTIGGTALDQVTGVRYGPVSAAQNVTTSFRRSLLIGLGYGLGVLLLIAWITGWSDFTKDTGGLLFRLVASAILGQVLSFISVFLPSAVQSRKKITLFTILLQGNKSLTFAVETGREQEVVEILQSFGLQRQKENR